MGDVGVVVIGRNEGERLRRCLASLSGPPARVVYVDSGSSDGSAAVARAMGVEVLELDPARPFSAARARNEGFRHLRALSPGLRKVQFADGDCEVVRGWIETASAWLDAHTEVAVVCGRRREVAPERSVYNLLCDIEWDTPVGELKSCGGDAMVRADAFAAVGGYRADLIAGEDPELCVRMRAAGWRIWRLDAEMTRHDAAMTRFSQWWKRTVRTGYAYAQGAMLHGAPPERHCVREARSAWCWGLGLPLGAAALWPWSGAWSLLLLLAYPAQVLRLAAKGGRAARENWWRAAFLVLGKFPEMLGQAKFAFHRYLAGPSGLIEYK